MRLEYVLWGCAKDKAVERSDCLKVQLLNVEY